jgi:hypothetical protein
MSVSISYKSGTLANVATPVGNTIDDFVKATMELMIKKGTFTNLLSDLNDYVAVRELMGRHKKLYEGEEWTFNVAVAANNTGNGTAKFTKLFDTDTSARVDALLKGKVVPKFVTASYSYDLREKALNSGSAVQRIDFIKEQMTLMYQSFYDLMERTFWGARAHKADDVTPDGIAYWVTRQSNSDAASHANGGFDGKDPSMATSSTVSTPTTEARAGISSASYARWANWAAQYAAVSKDDLVKKMRLATRKTNFKSPLNVSEPKLGSGRGIYTTTDVVVAMEEILEAQNMNLGNDLASKDGKTLFKGNPVYNVPQLDSDTQAPVYMLDWSTLGMGVLSGWDKRVSAPKEDADRHNVRNVFLDASMAFVCTNLRNQAVIAKAFA